MIGVVIVNYNKPQLTLNCLNSLERLDLLPDVVIVVDNGSDTGIEELQKYKSEKFRYIFLSLGENYGFGYGNNRGAEILVNLNCEYVWLLNNDTVVHHTSLKLAAKYLADNLDLGAVGFKIYYLDRPDQVQAFGGGKASLLLGKSRHIIEENSLDKVNYLTAASMIIRSEVILQIGLFDEQFFMYWEDVDLSLRMRKSGWKIGVAKDALIYHAESASSRELGIKRQAIFSRSLSILLAKHTPNWNMHIKSVHFLRLVKKLFLGNISEAKIIFKEVIR